MTIRDDIRAGALKTKTLLRKEVTLNGTKFELEQPLIEDVLSVGEKPTAKERIIHSIIRYARVPGTNETLFDTADFEALAKLPWDAEFKAIQDAVNELMGANVKEAEKNSVATDSGTTS